MSPPRPTATPATAVCYDRFTSTPDVQSLGTSVAPRIDAMRSQVASGTVGPGAILPYRLWQLRLGLRAFPATPSTRRPPNCELHGRCLQRALNADSGGP
jgi:hypothetical protein